MSTHEPPDPIELAKAFGVPQTAFALRLHVTPDWARRLAADPRHRRRVLVAVLEAALEKERLAHLFERFGR